jgi:hypothetical protein
MENQPVNIKPNGPEEITSMIMVKTILELHADELLTTLNEAVSEGRQMGANIAFSMHKLLIDVLTLVQASIDNDFDEMNNILADVGAVEIQLREDDEQTYHDMLQEVLTALCPDNPGLARLVWLTSLKMIEDAKSGGLLLSAYPQTQSSAGPNRAQRRQAARKKK